MRTKVSLDSRLKTILERQGIVAGSKSYRESTMSTMVLTSKKKKKGICVCECVFCFFMFHLPSLSCWNCANKSHQSSKIKYVWKKCDYSLNHWEKCQIWGKYKVCNSTNSWELMMPLERKTGVNLFFVMWLCTNRNATMIFTCSHLSS